MSRTSSSSVGRILVALFYEHAFPNCLLQRGTWHFCRVLIWQQGCYVLRSKFLWWVRCLMNGVGMYTMRCAIVFFCAFWNIIALLAIWSSSIANPFKSCCSCYLQQRMVWFPTVCYCSTNRGTWSQPHEMLSSPEELLLCKGWYISPKDILSFSEVVFCEAELIHPMSSVKASLHKCWVSQKQG